MCQYILTYTGASSHIRLHVKYNNTHCFLLKHIPKRGGSGTLLIPFTPWWKVPCFYTVAVRFSVGSYTLRRLWQVVSSCAEVHVRACTAGGIQMPKEALLLSDFWMLHGTRSKWPKKNSLMWNSEAMESPTRAEGGWSKRIQLCFTS